MKATGIVRRIDDLGRVVIPKEIRRTMRIREGEPLEIFTDREGEIILKKYSPVGEMGTLAKLYAESLSLTTGCTVCITDTDQVIAASGSGKKEFQDHYITKELEEVLDNRKQTLSKADQPGYIKIAQESDDYTAQTVCPILHEGDVIGSVILLCKNSKNAFGELEQKIAMSAADFLGRQIG